MKKSWWRKLPKRLRNLICGSLCVVGLAMIAAVLIFRIETDRFRVANVPHVQSLYTVADILASRPASTLVGSQHELSVLRPTLGKRHTFALNACPSANDAVVKQLQKRSIAVLVTIANNPAGHQCTLAQIVQAYGRPNASNTITGPLSNPKEVLLYFDKGPGLSGPLMSVSPPQSPATVIPMTLATLPAPTCASKTVMSFVAHEDDDILFMNPDHQHEIRSTECLRTVFLTAGDDGLSKTYWLGREKGAEAAYDSMVGHGSSLWIERYVSVNNHEYIKMASPRGNPTITLIFVNLPDGNVPGNGFLRTHYESLAKLANGTIATMHTVDGRSSYSKNDLAGLIARLMQFYHPDEIDTQAPIDDGASSPDHSDHKATGKFTESAHAQYMQNVPLKYYTGYPIGQLPQNVNGQDLTDKTAAFYAYVPHDAQVCLNPADCASNGPYFTWIRREYTYTPGSPLIPLSPTPSPIPADPTPSPSPETPIL